MLGGNVLIGRGKGELASPESSFGDTCVPLVEADLLFLEEEACGDWLWLVEPYTDPFDIATVLRSG